MDSRELIKVGKIVGTHGYRGTLKVQALTDFPERFQPGQRLITRLGQNYTELTLDTCSLHRGLLLMKFREVNSIEEGEQYRNAFLSVTAEQLYPLPNGHYYHFQLVGMKVEDIEKGFLGEITDVLETGANDVYVIRSNTYGEILIPAIKEVIREVDVEQQRMLIKLLPGLLGETK